MQDNILSPEQIDRIILRIAGETSLKAGVLTNLDGDRIFQRIKAEYQQVIRENVEHSFERLAGRDYVMYEGMPKNSIITLNHNGFEAYLKEFFSDYESVKNNVGTQIVNHNVRNSEALTKYLKQPSLVIRHILILWRSQGEIDTDNFENRIGVVNYNESFKKRFIHSS